jgi:hypothetical protein
MKNTNKELILKKYLEWVESVSENNEHKTFFTPKEIVFKVIDIVEKENLEQETLDEDYESYQLAKNLFEDIYGYKPEIVSGNQQHELIVASLQKGIVYGSKHQKIDGKNMMHCMRLIKMATEIGEGKGIIVRRPDAQELLTIRRGEVDLDSLIEIADKAIENMDEVFEKSNLPNNVDKNLVNNLLVSIRTKFYNPNEKNSNFFFGLFN